MNNYRIVIMKVLITFSFLLMGLVASHASEPARINLIRSSDYISLSYGHKNKVITDCEYEIYPLGNTCTNTIFSANRTFHKCIRKRLDGKIPLSELKEGLNIVKVTLPNGKSRSIKVVTTKHK